MDIIDLKRKAEAEEGQELVIFNPLNEDLHWKYDGVDQVVIPSRENISLKTSLAKHAGNLLVDLYLNTKDKNYPRERAERLVFP